MSLGLKSCGLSLESTLSFGNPPINVLVLPLAAVLALPASYHHPDYITQPTNVTKRIHPWRPPCSCKTQCWNHLSSGQRLNFKKGVTHQAVHLFYTNVCKYWTAESQQTTKKLPELHTDTSQAYIPTTTHTNMSYALQWFCLGCSSAQMGSLPCPTWQSANM